MFSFTAHLPKPREFAPKNTPGTIKALMSTLVPSRKLLVPSTPSSYTLSHKHADKVHPQKQLFKGQAKQEPFHAHKIQNIFSTFLHKKMHVLISSVCKQLLSPGAQVCGCYVRAHTDANSRTTIAKAGKRRRRGGGSREEDAARPEGGSRHHSPDAEMPGQERPVTASLPDDFPGGPLPAATRTDVPSAVLQWPALCSAGTGQLSGAERIPSLRRPRRPPPPAALRSLLRRQRRREGRRFREREKSRRLLFPSALLTRRAWTLSLVQSR